ncbi:MAG: phosphoglycerate dehydrogenase [Melioribacteraceae bacterium]|nr:phosphoglycerate dehydrogenase [Melioribacteraceae bacterium]
MNTPGGNTVSAAEHTISMIFALCRNIPQATQSMKEGKWEKKKFSGTELEGKTLGIVGLGKIGFEVAKRMKAFGVKIISFDPLLAAETADKVGVKLIDLPGLFAEADIITFHVPLNEETANLINKSNLDSLKKDVKIINCSRGGVIDEEAILKGLNDGIISGAALDVFSTEPPGLTELIKHEKVICTPHLAASTEEAQEKVAVQIAGQISDYFKTGTASGMVNGLAIKYLHDNELKPYLTLSEKLGLIHKQTLETNCGEVELDIYGEYLSDYSDVLATSFLKGFLTSYSETNVNLINAKQLAEEKGIKIKVSTNSRHSHYNNLICAKLSEKVFINSLEGTITGKNNLRIIKVDDYKMEFEPAGNLIIYNNVDRPGVLARAGAILADNNINIASVSLSRIEKGSAALTIMNIDEEVSKEVKQKLKSINGIEKINFIKL